MKVKVLHIITTLDTGGAERSLVKLLQSADHETFEHHVVSLIDKGTQGPEIERLGIPVSSLGMKKGTRLLPAVLHLRRLVRALRPAIIHAWMYHGALASLFAGRKTVRIMGVRNSLNDISREKPLTRMAIRYLGFRSAAFDSIVYNSFRSKEEHELAGYHPAKARVIPNGFDLNRFSPDKTAGNRLRKAWGIDESDMVVGHIARWHPMKNHPGLLRAFSALLKTHPRAFLLMAGLHVDEGNRELTALVDELRIGGHVLLLGERKDVPELLNACSFYVSPSWGESFPNAIGEAMSCGIPCLATDVGDCGHIMGESGILVPSGDDEALAAGMKRMAELGPDEFGALGRKARERIMQHFPTTKSNRMMEDLYMDLLPKTHRERNPHVNKTRRKKILLCSNTLWSMVRFRFGLMQALADSGYEVVCVADTDRFSALSQEKLTGAGIRFIRLRVSRRGMNPLSDLAYFLRFRRMLKREKPDFLINYTVKPIVYGSLAARCLKVPSFAVSTGLGFVFTRSNLLTRITRTLYRLSLRFPKRVFFLNPDDMHAFVDAGIVNSRKALLLPGEGVDTKYFAPDKGADQAPGGSGTVKEPAGPLAGNARTGHPRDESPGSKPFVFLLVARLVREKGIMEYVESAGLMKEARGTEGQLRPAVFRLAGYLDEVSAGGIKKELLRQWEDKGLIHFLGQTEDIRPWLREADCVVLPSYREGVPRTLMEAAAMEKPLIASDCPGCREVVDHGVNGLLCFPRNAHDLFEKMKQMIELPEGERREMGQRGREKMLTLFDEKLVISKYMEELE